LDSIALFLEDIIHLDGCYLQIFPAFEHVCGVEGCSSDGSNVHVLMLDPANFIEDVLLIELYLLKILHCLGHLFHILRLAFQFGHDTADILFYLFAFEFN